MTSLSRRDAVAVLLGAPLAASACDFLPRRTIEGTIRGGAHEVGHLLRDGVQIAPATRAEPVTVAIVGAGPAGLSAAWRLERLGVRDYVVLDLERQAGGTSAFGTDGVCAYPWGAHYVPVPGADNRALVALLREIGGLEPDDAPRGVEGTIVRAPEERVFADGHWQEGLVPRSRIAREDAAELQRFSAEMARLGAVRDGGGRRAFTLPLALCSDDASLLEADHESASAWLRRKGFRSDVLRWYVDYACRDDYGLTVDQTSAWSMLFYYASRLSGAEREGAPLLTWPEGNGRIVRHLMGVAGKRVRLGQLVVAASEGDGGAHVDVMDARDRSSHRIRAEHVVLAVPDFVRRRILGEVARLEGPSPTHGAWMVANIHLRTRPASHGFPFAWDNVLYDSPSLGYVVATHQTLRDLGPTIWTYYKPMLDDDPKAGRRALLGLEHGEIADAIVADLGRAHPGLEEAIERIDVWRWGHGMVRSVPGLVSSARRWRGRAQRGRLHFAHSDLSAFALFEEAQYHGVVAAEAIARSLGRSFDPLYPS